MEELDIKEPVSKVVGKVEGWIEGLIALIPNILVAILFIILVFIVAKLIQKLSRKLLQRATDDVDIQQLFTRIIYYVVLALGFFITLEILQLSKAVTSLLAGLGVLGLALGFAFQDIAANFISGIILAFRKPFHSGHIVEISDEMGTIVRTNMRETVLRTFQGQEVFVPNKEVLQNKIINYSITRERRIDLPVGISYGDDLEKVRDLVLETIGNLDSIKKDKDIIFDFYEFGSSSINFNIRFWIDYPGQPGFLQARNDAIMAIKKAFDENDITIPFPIRTLDFGIKGGEKLSELNLQKSLGRRGDTPETNGEGNGT
jgi:small conductance mechanosensitive channel